MMMDMLSFWDDAMEELYFGKGIFQGFDMELSVPRGIFQGYGWDFPVTSGCFDMIRREHSGILGNYRGILAGIFRDIGDLAGISGMYQFPGVLGITLTSAFVATNAYLAFLSRA